MIVVSNTTPLVGLASIGQFHLLRQMFREIYIPQAVQNEAVVKQSQEGGARQEILTADWINFVNVKNRTAVQSLTDALDLGEAETIVLAQELDADWVLMDEKKGRNKLAELSLNKIGTVGILLKAKQIGLLTALGPELDKLEKWQFRISQSIVDAILRQAGER